MKTIRNNAIDRFAGRSTAKLALVVGMMLGLALCMWAAEGPSVQLGAVAQRYPWNGTIDVSYKASGLPATGTNATITVTACGKEYKQNAAISNGTNTVAFTGIADEIKAKDARVRIVIK